MMRARHSGARSDVGAHPLSGSVPVGPSARGPNPISTLTLEDAHDGLLLCNR